MIKNTSHLTNTFMQRKLFSLIHVHLVREVDRDCNTTGSATETKFKGPGGTVGLNKKLIWCFGRNFDSIKSSHCISWAGQVLIRVGN